MLQTGSHSLPVWWAIVKESSLHCGATIGLIKYPLTPVWYIVINRGPVPLIYMIYMSNGISNGGYFQWWSQGTF